jgi:1-hydroxycarotenoid 3,4-desaturase
MSVSDHRVVVVGAGVAGLTSALLLAARGLAVTVVEAAATPGGKMRHLTVDGVPVDSGPTVFTMRWIFDAVFEAIGERLDDHLQAEPLDLLARHAWRPPGGGAPHEAPRLDLWRDLARSADEIGRFAGPDEARRFLGFCAEARRVYRRLEGPYIRSARPGLWRLSRDLGPSGVALLASLGPMASLWRSLGRHFRDARLRQLFARYATYCGSSPWLAPATLMLITQVELDGVWRVRGGMHAVARVLAGLAERRGVVFRYGTRAEELVVRDGRAVGVRVRPVDAPAGESSVALAADTVIFNGDVNALASGHLGESARSAASPVPRSDRSLSALTWSMHADARGFPLAMHNVFFDDDYRSEFADIFEARRLPRRGTVYVCAPDRDDDGARRPDRPGAFDRLLCLVNAPAQGDVPAGENGHLDAREIDACEHRSFSLLQACGLRLDRTPANTVRTTPSDFERLFPATGGALYGRASHGWMTQFHRPGSSSRLPGLMLAGGSVHPGPGVPMAAMSGRLVAEALMAHLDSTSRSRRAATSGGTSTPSATTAATR